MASVKIVQIRKRDGRIVDFAQEKITRAIWGAAQAVGGKDRKLAERLCNRVVAYWRKNSSRRFLVWKMFRTWWKRS